MKVGFVVREVTQINQADTIDIEFLLFYHYLHSGISRSACTSEQFNQYHRVDAL